MIEDSANQHAKKEQSEQPDELQMWSIWLQQSAAIGTGILHLLQLELRLAIADSKRLVIVALLFIPMLIMTWISFTVLLSWLVYQLNSSITQGLCAFFISQTLALIALCLGWHCYKKSLSLPLSREHIKQLVRGQYNDT